MNFLQTSCEFLTNFLWISYKLLVNFLQTSCEFLTNFLWISYKLLVNFLQTSCEFLTNFLWISYKLLVNFLQTSLNFLFMSYKLLLKFWQTFYETLTNFLRISYKLFMNIFWAPNALLADFTNLFSYKLLMILLQLCMSLSQISYKLLTNYSHSSGKLFKLVTSCLCTFCQLFMFLFFQTSYLFSLWMYFHHY